LPASLSAPLSISFTLAGACTASIN
jgi:hypothetical protein